MTTYHLHIRFHDMYADYVTACTYVHYVLCFIELQCMSVAHHLRPLHILVDMTEGAETSNPFNEFIQLERVSLASSASNFGFANIAYHLDLQLMLNLSDVCYRAVCRDQLIGLTWH